MVEAADGGGGGASLADVPALRAAGEQFRTFANVVTGIAQTDNLQSGGEFERQLLAADDVNLGASTTSLQTTMGSVARAFLEALIAAAPQLGDAAVDLFDCAGAFAAADIAIPAGAVPIGNGAWEVRTAPTHYTVYERDNEGHVVVSKVVHPDPPQPGPAPTPPSPGTPSTPSPAAPRPPSPYPTPSPTP
ncbi:MAG: hypothetical protein J2P57_17810 [Acidimicrobiaceae bacterium]|nr:hypothetical protein [Acidimicrobiaceae bacterium]